VSLIADLVEVARRAEFLPPKTALGRSGLPRGFFASHCDLSTSEGRKGGKMSWGTRIRKQRNSLSLAIALHVDCVAIPSPEAISDTAYVDHAS
jgi:hypothetical protein